MEEKLGMMQKLPSCIGRFSPHYRPLWEVELRESVSGGRLQLDQEAELANHCKGFLERWKLMELLLQIPKTHSRRLRFNRSRWQKNLEFNKKRGD